MRIRYKPSFRRDMRRVRNPIDLRRIDRKIAEIKAAQNIREVSNVIKMSTRSGNDYRIRVGDYRIGVVLEGNIVEMHRIFPRDDIYRRFP